MKNPQAFPMAHPLGCTEGMTLLDYFAGQALIGYISNLQNFTWDQESVGKKMSEIVSKNSYEYATAMLAEREKIYERT